ncbi:MAG: cysW2, partial [Thermomicrobiales bacterium]|nr:cysW2 [Thermomicrobiales bacterium]
MEYVTTGLAEAAQLLIGGNAAVWEVVLLSLRVSLVATAVALLIGVPAGAALALARFPGRSLAIGALY